MVNIYAKEIKKYKPLNKEEEKICFVKNKDSLITHNLKYVMKIAHKYKNQGFPIEDLISEGNIGLIRAIDTFDPSKDYKFITYATNWIEYYIRDYVKKEKKYTQITDYHLNILETKDIYNNEEVDISIYLDTLISKLNSKEKTVIKTYYGLGEKRMGLKEIGKRDGKSTVRIQNIKDTAIRKMKSEYLLMRQNIK